MAHSELSHDSANHDSASGAQPAACQGINHILPPGWGQCRDAAFNDRIAGFDPRFGRQLHFYHAGPLRQIFSTLPEAVNAYDKN